MYESRFPHPNVTDDNPGPWGFQAYYDGKYEDLAWTEGYLGQRGQHVWAHPDRYAQVGCHITPDGEFGIGFRHAEPVLTWTSPYPDNTEVRVSGRICGTYQTTRPTCHVIYHNDQWIWNGQWVDPGFTKPFELLVTVNKGDVIRFQQMTEHGYHVAAGRVGWDVDDRRNDYQEYAGATRHWAVGVIRLSQKSAGGQTYYLDDKNGEDGNDGMSPETPWKSLGRVNAVRFAPGDSILLKAGGRWTGKLQPYGNGTDDKPITVGSYGEGPKPHIAGEGQVEAALYFYDQGGFAVEGLELSNQHPRCLRSQLCGLLSYGENGGELSKFIVRDCFIHDIDGFLGLPHRINHQGSKLQSGGIMFHVSPGCLNVRYNGIFIENCIVRDCDRAGIGITNINVDVMYKGGGLPLKGAVVRNCRVERPGGDAIILIKCERPLVEHCVVAEANYRDWANVLGISTAYCDHAVIQFNEVWGMKTRNASQAFGADHGSRNTVIQYNYSHHNEAGFFLSASRGRGTCYSERTIVRYNVSVDDETNVFQLAGPSRGTRIYNNTVYLSPGSDTRICSHHEDGGYPADTVYTNNLIINHGSGGYALRKSKGNVFKNNVFFGNHPESEPEDHKKKVNDPMLLNPGVSSEGRHSALAYTPRENSYVLDSGEEIPYNGGKDFTGNLFSEGCAPGIGAIIGPKKKITTIP